MDKILEINELIKKYSEMGIISSKNISDGHHTFREIYNERFILFCVICNIFLNYRGKQKNILMRKTIRCMKAILLQV